MVILKGGERKDLRNFHHYTVPQQRGQQFEFHRHKFSNLAKYKFILSSWTFHVYIKKETGFKIGKANM